MKLWLTSFVFIVLLPSFSNTIRCYKCDATDECRIISNDLSSKNYGYSSENVEIVECDHYCWKSVSLGNVYRGCANRRCVVSHNMGTFSSSVCCQKDYCNQSNQVFLTKFLYLSTLVISLRYY